MFSRSLLMLILLAGVIVFTLGCGEGGETIVSNAINDDATEPGTPIWTSSPYSVENVYDGKYIIQLRWNPVATNKNHDPKTNIAGYKILKSDVNGNLLATYLVAPKVNSTYEFYTDTDSENLEQNKQYTYRIICFDTNLRESDTSAPQMVRVYPEQNNRPARPSQPNYVVDELLNRITIFWEPVTIYEDGTSIAPGDLMGYEVYRSGPVDLSRPETPVAIVKGDSTHYVDVVELTEGKKYRYWLRAVHKFGAISTYSDSITLSGDSIVFPQTEEQVIDAKNIPGAPYLDKIIVSTDGTRTLQWDAPLTSTDGTIPPNVIRYLVYRSTNINGPYTILGDTFSTSFTFNNLNSTYYYYRVSAVDNYNNEGPLSNIMHYDWRLLPPININFLPTSTSYLNVRNDPSYSSETSNRILITSAGEIKLQTQTFNVYRALRAEGPYNLIGNVANTALSPSFSENLTYTDSQNVVKDITYYYRVTAINLTSRESSPSPYAAIVAQTAAGLKFNFEDLIVSSNVSDSDEFGIASVTYNVADENGDTHAISFEVTTANFANGNNPWNGAGKFIEFRTNTPFYASGSYTVKVRYNDVAADINGRYRISIHAQDATGVDQWLNQADDDRPYFLTTAGFAALGWQEWAGDFTLAPQDVGGNNDFVYIRVWYDSAAAVNPAPLQLFTVEFTKK